MTWYWNIFANCFFQNLVQRHYMSQSCRMHFLHRVCIGKLIDNFVWKEGKVVTVHITDLPKKWTEKIQHYFVENKWENIVLFSKNQAIAHTLIKNSSFLRAQNMLKFEFAAEAITIFIKNIKQELRAHMALVTRQEELRAKSSYGMSSNKIQRINGLI